MQAFFSSTLLVAAAEVGDKTQLLSFVLAARLRKPWPILAGILAATALNHLLAGTVGVLMAKMLAPEALAWIVGLSFIAFGLWALKPDRLEGAPVLHSAGVFMTTFVAFFIAEMGDKTQFATVALAARYDALAQVVVGTTLGMLVANAPAVWVGERLSQRLPMRGIRFFAAALFLIMGVLTLFSAGGRDG